MQSFEIEFLEDEINLYGKELKCKIFFENVILLTHCNQNLVFLNTFELH